MDLSNQNRLLDDIIVFESLGLGILRTRLDVKLEVDRGISVCMKGGNLSVVESLEFE